MPERRADTVGYRFNRFQVAAFHVYNTGTQDFVRTVLLSQLDFEHPPVGKFNVDDI